MRNRIKTFTGGLASTYLFFKYVACISLLEGPSMLPTFNLAGDVVLVDKLFFKYSDLKIGSILVYISPMDPDRLVMKRVLGRAGDLVYIDPTKSSDMIRVPEGHLWMQGDNYTYSNDCRFYGPIPIGLIQGRILFRLFPFDSWESF